MDDLRLPEDLQELERKLAARAMAEPSPGLRDRVIAAIRQESAHPRHAGEAISLWRFAAAVAANLLLCLNLYMSVAKHADWDVWGERGQVDVTSAAELLREAVPELSEQEASRMARVMASGSRLILVPDLKGHSGWWRELKRTATTTIWGETENGPRPRMD